MSSLNPLRVHLRSPDPSLLEWWIDDVGAERDENGIGMNFSGRRILFYPEPPPEESPDLVLGMIRFVDLVSLQKMSELLEDVISDTATPALILVYRNENEQDFKMSCPYCGQKLWVRDTDKDKRGRCPHCGKGFTLPAQVEHVRSALRLNARVPIHLVVRQDPGTFAAPLRGMLDVCSVEHHLNSLKYDKTRLSNETMRVNVED